MMPMERCCDLLKQTPLNEKACYNCDAGKESVQERNHKVERPGRAL
jgi:hypothetical protein